MSSAPLMTMTRVTGRDGRQLVAQNDGDAADDAGRKMVGKLEDIDPHGHQQGPQGEQEILPEFLTYDCLPRLFDAANVLKKGRSCNAPVAVTGWGGICYNQEALYR